MFKPIDHVETCKALKEWFDIFTDTHTGSQDAFETVRLAIEKSCLLDRMMNVGVKPSQTKCPVHKGVWSGCHINHPGDVWVGIKKGKRFERPADVDPALQAEYDAGCRCYMHGCGCTTGWNPDVNSHGVNYPHDVASFQNMSKHVSG